jgi:DNA-binding SARP family transcriptional activator
MNRAASDLPVFEKRSMLLATMAYGGGRGGRALHWLFGDVTFPVPGSLYEVLLGPVYLIPLGWAVFLALTASGPSIPILIAAGVIIGLVGICYPTRRFVGFALVLFWWAIVLVGPAIEGLRVWMGLIALLLTAIFVRYLDWAERNRDREFHAKQSAREHAKRDRAVAAFLPGPLSALRANLPLTLPDVPGTKTVSGLRIVELNRHFDSQLEASAEGTLHEWSRNRGWSTGIGIGPFGISRGWGGGATDGVLNFDLRGKMQEDWTHENFVVVLERDDGADVVRLIVPSDPAVHEYLQNLLWTWQRNLVVNSASELLVRRNLYDLPGRIVCDAAYVADRLSAIQRMEPARRPEISIVGAPAEDHALLGGAIEFGRDGRWYQLFPVAIVSALIDLMNGRLPQPAPAVEVPELSTDAPYAEPTPVGATDAAPVAASDAAAPLTVATIGQFTLRKGADDLTTALTQKPLMSFLWQYLLARAVHNPRDVISRAALADEVFPTMDPKLQRTRLRQRLSDLQTSLPPELAGRILSEGERVRFNPDGAVVDAVKLRMAATSITAARAPVGESELKDLVELATAIGDDAFMPEWEALEQKITVGRSSVTAVVEEARADVERWRTAVLLAIADAYSSRVRPAVAISYLERVVRSHPENELATKKLIAAYLETGQSDRARQLQETKATAR